MGMKASMEAAPPTALQQHASLHDQCGHSPLEGKASVNQVVLHFIVELGLWGR